MVDELFALRYSDPDGEAREAPLLGRVGLSYLERPRVQYKRIFMYILTWAHMHRVR